MSTRALATAIQYEFAPTNIAVRRKINKINTKIRDFYDIFCVHCNVLSTFLFYLNFFLPRCVPRLLDAVNSYITRTKSAKNR